tara:strand:+ start:565 stop:1725 length:1161 start_codon:yes stop_codon:yes gene_type:complete
MIRQFFILPFVIFSFAFSDCYDIEIVENSFNDSIIGIYLSAIDLNTGATTIPIFDYSIIVNDDTSCKSFNIRYKIEILSPEMGFNSNFIFAEGGFTISDLPLNVKNINFRNTDLNFSTNLLPSGARLTMDPGIKVNADNSSIRSVIMESGKIPNGTYTFSFSDSESNILISKAVDIYEPTTFELIGPGGSFINIDENSISTSFPVFQWNSDLCPKCNIGIRVSEFNKEKHSTVVEALNDVSSLPISTIDRYYFFNSSTNNTFQYPFNQALGLQPGKKYVWQLIRQYTTTQGEVNNYSEIFAFNIKDFSSDNSQNNQFDMLSKEKLILILGEEKFQELFSNDGDLSEFTVSSLVVKSNGSIITPNQLNIIIDKIESKEIQIKSYKIK